MSSAVLAPTAAPRVALPRDVYRSAKKIDGQWAYFAVTSEGRKIGPYRARHDDGEDDADVVTRLIRRLEWDDPVRHLTLVPASPAVSAAARSVRSWLLSRQTSRLRGPSVQP